MSQRFVADVWAVAQMSLEFNRTEVLYLAEKSQDLYRMAGINTASTGKMSTKQAVRKMGAGINREYSEKLGTEFVSFIFAFRKADNTLAVFFEDGDEGYEVERFATAEFSLAEGQRLTLGAWNYAIRQVKAIRDEMLRFATYVRGEEEKKQPQTESAQTTKIAPTMGQQTPQELMLQAMSMLQGGGSIDEAAVEKIVDKRLKEQRAVKVEVVSAKATKRVDKAHKNFADAVALVGLGKNIAMIGEAGSGKSYGAIQMAQALDLDYSVVSCHGKMQSFDLVGAMSPTTGQYISTALRDAYENGKVLILDEFDRSNNETTIALNGILAGDCYGFPDGMVKRNPAFRVIACQNTFGSGSSKTYASAKPQDGSTLTRFTRIKWDIDAKLEIAICGDNNVTRAVQSIRQNAKEKGYDQILITPRQAIDANQIVDSLGWTAKKAIEFTCLNGLADDVKKRLMDGVSL